MKLVVQKSYYVYLAANSHRTKLTVGSTGDIISLINKIGSDGVEDESSYIVYCESLINAKLAIRREEEISNFSFRTKKKLLEQRNPHWLPLQEDLFKEIIFPVRPAGVKN